MSSPSKTTAKVNAKAQTTQNLLQRADSNSQLPLVALPLASSHIRTYSPKSQVVNTVAEFVSAYDTVQQAKRGVSASLIPQVQKGLGLTLKELAALLGIAESTIHRYKQAGKEQPPTITDVSMGEQLLLLQALTTHGQVIFRKPEGFAQWLRKPQWELDDQPPLSFLVTSQGILLVNDSLGRIEHGIPV